YTEDGFKFLNTTLPNQADSFGSWQNSSGAYAGSTTLFNQYQDAITQLSRVGGGAFDVSSIDLASLNLSPLPNTVTFTGTRGDNSTVVNAITMSNPSALLTYNFTGMTNIVKLEWAQSIPFHQFDNINVNSVPEPATMSALALGVLAFARRRRHR
ncbi:MAG TPA: PEP-CTERM sorting domain-containing protein, partial [Fimbriimonas sp.]|nr:PEP-CTERM sorting domain-containing protein [Fimbriimonas sp.]